MYPRLTLAGIQDLQRVHCESSHCQVLWDMREDLGADWTRPLVSICLSDVGAATHTLGFRFQVRLHL